MKKIKLIRFFTNGFQTLGVLSVTEGDKCLFVAKTLERGWLNNQPNVSCIPPGIYNCIFTRSPLFSKKAGKDVFTYEIAGVQNRAGIRIHSANFYSQLNGCIALGNTVKDLNMDGHLDVEHSGNTMKIFEELLGKKSFQLQIIANY